MTTQNTPSWNPISALVHNCKNYTKFSGRASRAQYWWFMLAFMVLSVVTCYIAYFALLIPCIACGFRRMQDTGKPGWFIFIPIYSLILALTPSAPANQYGEGPELPTA